MTGDTWLNAFSGKIFSLQDIGDNFLVAVRRDTVQAAQDVHVLGGMLTTKATLTVASDQFTLSAPGAGYAPSGDRLVLTNTIAEGWVDIPFEDLGATVYHVGARFVDVPVVAEPGADGLAHFGHFAERQATIFNPTAVSAAPGDGLLLTMTAALPAGMKATTSTGPRKCVVWYQDTSGRPATSNSTLAIEVADLIRVGAIWRVETAAKFGQSTFSTVGARYNVAVLGGIPYRSTELPGDWTTHYLFIGTITSGVFDNSAAPLIAGVAGLTAKFAIEHDVSTGLHTDINADRADVGSPVGLTSAAGAVTAEAVEANGTRIREGSTDALTTAHVDVQQLNGTSKIQLRAGDPASAIGGGSIHFPNPDQSSDNAIGISTAYAGQVLCYLTNNEAPNRDMRIVVDGEILQNPTKTSARFGVFTDKAASDNFELEGLGAGVLNLRLLDGGIDVANGDIEAGNGEIQGWTFANAAGSYSVSSTGEITGLDCQAEIFICDLQAASNGYSYVSRAVFDAEYLPTMGGWTNLINQDVAGIGATIEYITGATPPHIRPLVTGTGTVTRMRYPLDATFNQARTSPTREADTLRIVSAAFEYLRATGSNIIRFRIKRVLRDGSGAEATVASETAPSTGAGFQTHTISAINHSVDPTFAYFLEVDIASDLLVTDAKMGPISIKFDKEGVE